MIKNLSLETDAWTKQVWLRWNGYRLPWFSEEEARELVRANTPKTIIDDRDEDDNDE